MTSAQFPILQDLDDGRLPFLWQGTIPLIVGWIWDPRGRIAVNDKHNRPNYGVIFKNF